MPDKHVHTAIDGQKIKLSNLDKILYPSIHGTKAEVIQYYLDIAPRILTYIGNRPLTVIRYPDGVKGASFYSKDKPDWTPDWLPSIAIEHERKTIDYIYTNNKAGLAWLANLACLELHPMQFESLSDRKPDLFIIDIDPDEQITWEQIKSAASMIRDFLTTYGYHPLVKTSGGKGLHIIVPIIAISTFAELIESVTKLMTALVKKEPTLFTLSLSKKERQGKILLDIYRNHITNTCVGAYSLRGREGAPISMPFSWEQLDEISSARHFTLRNYKTTGGDQEDPWRDWRQKEVELHDHRKTFQGVGVEKLETYKRLRDLNNTPEPPAIINTRRKDEFVLQLHDASNLHYDLRLEEYGVLSSWAIPKGLPFKKDQKRLAIRTEDHPIMYLDFEGFIPKGQYGGGQMRIVDKGTIRWYKKEKTAYSFSLNQDDRIFHLHQTKNDNQWLLSVDRDTVIHKDLVSPSHMLAGMSATVPTDEQYSFEVKWDGIRVMFIIDEDKVRLLSRSGRDITRYFPELTERKKFEIESAILDAEIVVLDEQGRPIFSDVISRMHKTSAAQKNNKPAVAYFFDVLMIDGRSVIADPLFHRQQLLSMLFKTDSHYRLSESIEDGAALFSAISDREMEGIMAKKKNSKYDVGQRSNDWLKIKCRSTIYCTIIGYTAGSGDRALYFGAIHVAEQKEGKWVYYGKVGTGFNQASLRDIFEKLRTLAESPKLIDDKIEEADKTTWVTPVWRCEVQYASWSANQTLREPVFKNLIEEDL